MLAYTLRLPSFHFLFFTQMLAKSFWGALLLLSPAITLAQTVPRLYVGASAVLTRFYPFEHYARTRVGPAATVGVQLSPRWAIETGAQLTWASDAYYNTYSTTPGVLDFASSSSRVTSLIAPLWARFTVTPTAFPWHMDMLGGISWLHSVSSGSSTYSHDGLLYPSSYSDTANSFCVGLGPQFRYSLGQHFDVKLNVPFNLRVNHQDVVEEFTRRLFFNPQLGVQYNL
ncbi:MAG: hypothetical protein EOO63_04435 [Hymenobacter sp.]|nr:MAG: hypothetical protein EOO63_04435 [Hymenobacter sp.]